MAGTNEKTQINKKYRSPIHNPVQMAKCHCIFIHIFKVIGLPDGYCKLRKWRKSAIKNTSITLFMRSKW